MALPDRSLPDGPCWETWYSPAADFAIVTTKPNALYAEIEYVRRDDAEPALTHHRPHLSGGQKKDGGAHR
jgi:hypothetical protein